MAKKKKKAAVKPSPRCKAILLCDQVIIDAMTGKPSVIGIFEVFNLTQIPGFTPPVRAFLQLTDGVGKYALEVEIHDLQRNVVIGRGQDMAVEFPEKLAKVNVIIPVPSLPIAHPGPYDFVVMADGQDIDRQKFVARVMQQSPQEPKEEQPDEDQD